MLLPTAGNWLLVVKSRAGCWRGIVGLLLMFALESAFAIEEMHLQVDAMEAGQWSLQGLGLDLDVAGDDSISAALSVANLRYAGQVLTKIHLQCPSVQLDARQILFCSSGQLSVEDSPFQSASGDVQWRYQDADRWSLKIGSLRFSGARLTLSVNSDMQGLKFSGHLRGFSLALLKPFFPSAWNFSGRLELQGRLTIEKDRIFSRATVKLRDFSYSSEDGLQVGEGLSLRLQADATQQKGAWEGGARLDVSAGQVYADPFFLEIVEDAPLSVSIKGGLDAKAENLRLGSFSITQKDMLSAQGQAHIRLPGFGVLGMELDYRLADLGKAYLVMVQPLVIGSALDDMRVAGRAEGRIEMADGQLQAFSLLLRNGEVEQTAGLFGVSDMNARFSWSRNGNSESSTLRWSGGHFYKIAFGPLDTTFEAAGDGIKLQPLALPLLQGRLNLEDFELQGLLEQNIAWQASATLKDIQLAALSEALGWPLMEGRLQALIPRLHYREARLSMDGELVVDVFGGRLVVEGLELEDPLGVAPVLETSVRLDNLDLEQLTQVFDFGRIQGSLEGYIRELRLVGWQVAGFDASLHSPRKDSRRRRISQRAIDNLTELGNGASVSLSTTMLRFFEDFAYQQLALRIRLQGAVAELDGVPGPKGGYYIVKGARLPRIDVIGRNHRVAWKDLLSRIRDIRFDDMIVE